MMIWVMFLYRHDQQIVWSYAIRFFSLGIYGEQHLCNTCQKHIIAAVKSIIRNMWLNIWTTLNYRWYMFRLTKDARNEYLQNMPEIWKVYDLFMYHVPLCFVYLLINRYLEASESLKLICTVYDNLNDKTLMQLLWLLKNCNLGHPSEIWYQLQSDYLWYLLLFIL